MSWLNDRHEKVPGKPGQELSGFALFGLHGACFLLVVFYVNMFQFWSWLSRSLGPGIMVKILPIIVTAVVLLVILFRFFDRVNRGYRINFIFLGLGLIVAIFSLAIPDSKIPIKRIHVAEYLALSFLVRATLSYRLQGLRLTLFTFFVTLLFGIHDEMLQGLNSHRYYGLRDIVVNGTAGLSGALLGHGLHCFVRPQVEAAKTLGMRSVSSQAVVLLFLGGCIAWLVVSLYQQRGTPFSLPALLPLAAFCLLIAIFRPKVVFNSRVDHGFQAVFWLAFFLLLYPLLANYAGIEFI